MCRLRCQTDCEHTDLNDLCKFQLHDQEFELDINSPLIFKLITPFRVRVLGSVLNSGIFLPRNSVCVFIELNHIPSPIPSELFDISVD